MTPALPFSIPLAGPAAGARATAARYAAPGAEATQATLDPFTALFAELSAAGLVLGVNGVEPAPVAEAPATDASPPETDEAIFAAAIAMLSGYPLGSVGAPGSRAVRSASVATTDAANPAAANPVAAGGARTLSAAKVRALAIRDEKRADVSPPAIPTAPATATLATVTPATPAAIASALAIPAASQASAPRASEGARRPVLDVQGAPTLRFNPATLLRPDPSASSRPDPGVTLRPDPAAPTRPENPAAVHADLLAALRPDVATPPHAMGASASRPDEPSPTRPEGATVLRIEASVPRADALPAGAAPADGAVRPAGPPPIALPMGDARWAEALADRVGWIASRGLEEARIRVTPPELGPIDVRISMDDGRATVYFSAPTEATRSALESHLHRLAERLTESGIALDSAFVSSGGTQAFRDPSRPAAFTSREREPELPADIPAARVLPPRGLVDDFA